MNILVVTNMYPHRENPNYGTFIKQQVEGLRALGHSVEVFFIEGYRLRRTYITCMWTIYQKTRTGKFDIVHAHYGLSSITALFRHRTPLVVTYHGSDVLLGFRDPFISKIGSLFADDVIIVSAKMAKRIPGHVIPSGIDMTMFRPYDKREARARLHLPLEKNLVLFPYDPKRPVKRFDLAKQAVDILVKKGINVEMVVLSNVQNEMMPWYYSAVDVTVLSSYSEGSPTAIKESICCNTPVVSTDVGDIRDIIDKIEGTFICRAEPEDFARGIEAAIKRAALVGFNGRPAMKRYDLLTTCSAIVDVYRGVLRKHGRAV